MTLTSRWEKNGAENVIDLDRIHALMRKRDLSAVSSPDARIAVAYELADEVPALVAEIERLRATTTFSSPHSPTDENENEGLKI